MAPQNGRWARDIYTFEKGVGLVVVMVKEK